VNHHRLALAAALLAVLALPACHPLAPQPDPTRFYVLVPMGGVSQSVVGTGTLATTIGLGPVDLPEYLDQTWMVSRREGNRLNVSSYDQWGEPLRDTFKEVLKQDLELELGGDEIIDYPWYRTATVDRQIIVEVINFEFDGSTNSAEIRANWRVVNVRTGGPDAHGQFVAAQNVASQSSGLERAAALSNLVHQLAQMLAQQVRHSSSIAQGVRISRGQVAFGD
jgi:hypothetical protein